MEQEKQAKYQISTSLREVIDILDGGAKACIYSNDEAKALKDALTAVRYPFEAEDCGGGSLAPELWRFSKKLTKSTSDYHCEDCGSQQLACIDCGNPY